MARQSLATRAARRRPAEITADREESINQMNTSLKRQFTLIEKTVNDLRAENLRYYHRIGKICEMIRQDPGAYVGKDGTPGMKLIERALSTQARTLRKAAMFANMYDDAQLTHLISLTNPTNKFQLHWGHVSFLLTVTTPEKRERYAQEAVEKLLDPGALHDLIKKRSQRSGGHGRKHVMPKTIAAQIRQVLSVCKQWVGKNSNVWNGEEESVFGNLLNMPPADMEPDMVAQLEEISGLFQEISEEAAENVNRTARVVEHMNAAITKRDADEAAAAASGGRNSRAIDLRARPARNTAATT